MPTPKDLGDATPLLGALLDRLRGAQAELHMADRYYEGEPPLPFLSRQAAHRYKSLLRQARTNWGGLIVDAVADRMDVEGFRLDAEVDKQAWEVWQANGLDAESSLVHTDALVYGTTYTMVWPDEESEVGVRITAESPYEVAHLWATGRAPRRAQAALKAWLDEEAGAWRAWVLTTDGTEEWRAEPRRDKGLPVAKAWRRAGATQPNPFQDLGHIGIVPFANRMRTRGEGRSELAGVSDHLDRINTQMAEMLLAGEFGAYRQKWATGLEVPEDDNGNPVEPFNVAVDRLLVSEDAETKFGQFDATDLRPFVDAVAQGVQHLASVTRTPPHYLLGDMVNLSAEALKAAEAGLVTKVRNRMKGTGESWEQTMRLALALRGNTEPGLQRMETVWADPENVSEAMRMDALTKMQSLQVPLEALWERIPGVTPTEVGRWRTMRGTDTMATMLRTGRVPAAPVAQGPEGTVVPDQPATPPTAAQGAAGGAASA